MSKGQLFALSQRACKPAVVDAPVGDDGKRPVQHTPLTGAPRPAVETKLSPSGHDGGTDRALAQVLDILNGSVARNATVAGPQGDAPPEVVADFAKAASPHLKAALAPHADKPVSQREVARPDPVQPGQAENGVESESPAVDRRQAERLEAVNRNTFVSHVGNGVMSIFREAIDHETRQHQVTPMTEEQLGLEYSAAAPVLVTKGGISRPVSVGKAWTLWPGRRTYPDGIGMWPDGDAPAGAYNLYRGLALDPLDGDAQPIVEHIAYMCGGSGPLADWVLNWLAFTVQAPGKRPETALVLRGGQGTGKGTLARLMLRFFGGHGLHLTQQKHLTGAFNGHLRYALLVVADEGWHAGSKEAEGVMKGLITEPTLVIEGKHKDARGGVPNRLKLMVLSNNEWVVPAGADERRYCVIDVPGDRAQDQDYFGKLNAWLDGGGDRIFLRHLLRHDLTGFNPRVAPRTAALDAQKIAAMSALDRWLLDALDTGTLPNGPWGRDVAELACGVAASAFEAYCRGVKRSPGGVDTRAIGKRLQGIFGCGPAITGGDKRRCWRLPGLSDARSKAARAFGLHCYHWGQA